MNSLTDLITDLIARVEILEKENKELHFNSNIDINQFAEELEAYRKIKSKTSGLQRVNNMDKKCTKCNGVLATVETDITVIANDMLESIIDTKSIDNDSCMLDIKCPICNKVNSIVV